ncbi:MAG TPA: hypothetical protein VGX69_08970 [Solirubrobacteraceae bacterium]|nr:hypothetical protein [Solirubrobacteraceae bacterium]
MRGPHLRRGGEVVGERRVGLDRHDLVVLGPYLREQREQELASLGGVGLGVPEAREVFEDGVRAVEVGVRRGLGALQLLLDDLAAHDVLGLGDVAHQIQLA